MYQTEIFTFEPRSQMRLTKRSQHIQLHNNGHNQRACETSINGVVVSSKVEMIDHRNARSCLFITIHLVRN